MTYKMAQAVQSTHNNDSNDALYLVDGSGFIFRAFHVMPPLTNSDGVPVGAVYGFVNMMVKLLNDFDASSIAVIFDAARENFRNDIYEEYKANRDETPEDLIPQFPLIRQATQAFDIPAIELEGFEADDLIATYAQHAKQQGRDVVIVSSDKDLMQLIQPGVRMFDPMKSEFMDEQACVKKFGVMPDKVIDVQALAGDSIDNVPGVPGIGVKTAAQLITEFGSLESLLERAEEIPQPKRREKLIAHADDARISKQLVTLADDVDVPVALDDLRARNKDAPKLIEFLQSQGFKSLVSRLADEHNLDVPASPQENDGGVLPGEETLPNPKDNHYTLITDIAELETWIGRAYERGILCIDTETTSLKTQNAQLVGIALAIDIGQAAYMPLQHISPAQDLFGDDDSNQLPDQIPVEKALAVLKPVLEDPSVLKIAHNMKYDWQIFKNVGIDIQTYDDTMLLSYVLDGTSHKHNMDDLANHYFGLQTIKFEEVAGKGKSQITFDQVSMDKALNYAAEDADVTLRLWTLLKPRLAREGKTHLYETIERPLVRTLAYMERRGIQVDATILKSMSHEFGKQIDHLQKEIWDLAGQEFNVASPKQIGAILFDHLGLQGGKKTKTGDWSTNAAILEELAAKSEDDGGHKIVQKILDWRSLSKLKSTYTDALQDEIHATTGRVHTSFMMTGTSTGRLSSRDPNLQNIPIRTEEGRKIRTAFVAPEGHKILSIDYSQVELRLAAEMADIQNLKAAFQNKADIHTLTAAQVMDVPESDVTAEQRRAAKAINFGIIYGISGYGLSKQIGVSPAEASRFIQKYLSRFSELSDFMEAKKQEARDNGYVTTLFGRKCVIPGITDKSQIRRSGAERQAINAPLQGTAADIMKKAMVKMQPALDKASLKAKMLLQIHDELIFEVPEDELDETFTLVKDVMENIVKLSVPLIAEGQYADSWADAH